MSSPDPTSLLAAEEARRQAMLANDAAALGALLSDALIYTHSSGGKDSRQSYLQKLISGALHYERVGFEQPTARVIGTVGLVMATMRASISSHTGIRREVNSNYLAVWEHGASGWMLQLIQGTPVPAVV